VKRLSIFSHRKDDELFWSTGVLGWLKIPNFRVSGVPPEADQVSGKKNKTTET
jgi:hypothetical protein